VTGGVEPVDVARVAAFLRERYGEAVGEVGHLGSGVWSRAYAFSHAGRAFVIRFGAHREDFEKDQLASRYASTALPVPAMVEIGEAYGGHYAISERRYGEYIDGVDGDQMRALLPSLFAALDAMRLVDISATTRYGIWGADGAGTHVSWRAALLDSATDDPARRTHGWRERLATSPTGAGPFEEAYRHLQTLVDRCPEERYLIHSDLLHFNVLVEGDRITAVLDWGSALYGDFLYDLAWIVFWQPWYPAWSGIDFQAEARRHYAEIGLEVPGFDERLLACQIHIGLDGQAYQAYAGRWDDLAATAQRTLDVARAGA
jgi:hygromycin-B 4-O-kinase